MKIIKFLLICFIVILFFNCKSVNKVIEKEPVFASGIANIEHNLSKNKIDLFEAYILASHLLTKNLNNNEEEKKILTYINDLIKQMDSKGVNLFKENKFEESLKYFLSLKTLNYNSSIELKDVYYALLKSYENSSDFYTIQSIKEEMADLNFLSDNDIIEFLKSEYNRKNKGQFIYYYDKYSKLYNSINKLAPELENYRKEMQSFNQLNFETLTESVVAVILNKGVNIKDGIGYLDRSIGTGFFIDDNGYILTNYHVIADHVDPKYEGYSAIYVTLKNDPDTEIPAEVIGYDKVFDIALLKIPKKNIKPLSLGRSTDIKLGDKVYAIGNPLGIKNTITAGIISNKEIYFFQLGRAYQIDAAVNPGNSGGPLLDESGQVIGVVFAGIPQYQGINFAIPFQWIRKTIPLLYKKNEVKRCWIGAGIYNDNNKVNVYYVLVNSSSDKAGLKVGDIINKIDGIPVKSVEEAQEVLSWKRYPMLLNIEITRENKIQNLIVKLEERPYLPLAYILEKDIQRKIITLVYGLDLDYYDKNIFLKKYKVNKIYKGMPASQLNISEGDSIYVYDLKYVEKNKVVLLTLSFKDKNASILERVITLPSYIEINSLL